MMSLNFGLYTCLLLRTEVTMFLSADLVVQQFSFPSPFRKAKYSLSTRQELAECNFKFLVSPGVDERVKAGIQTQSQVVHGILELPTKAAYEMPRAEDSTACDH